MPRNRCRRAATGPDHVLITCDLELKGLVVKVQDASIRALRIGACRAKGSVKCEGMLLIRRETKDLDLPGRITLSPGYDASQPYYGWSPYYR